jgi:hypothetical protein
VGASLIRFWENLPRDFQSNPTPNLKLAIVGRDDC